MKTHLIGFVMLLTTVVSRVSLAQCPAANGSDLAAGGTFSGNCIVSLGLSSITITGNTVWTSGTLQILGSPGNITIANGASLTINGGTIETVDDGPDLDTEPDGRISVNQGGTLTVASGASAVSYTFMTINGTANIGGTLTLQNGRLAIGSTGSLYIQQNGLVDVNGTGDNVIQGYMNIAGTLETNGDIDVNGGTLEVGSTGVITSTGTDIDLEVYGGGSFTLEYGGTASFNGDVINYDFDGDGCSGSPCPSGGSFDISGTLIVGDDLTITDTTSPESSFTSNGDTGTITVGGNFVDSECPYPEGTYTFCDCSGQSNFSACDTALPIELMQFSGQQKGASIVLQWSTASELNNDFFTIERLTQEDTFENIGEYSGSGTSLRLINYEAFDYNPAPGNNYYRLKQTDFSGAYEYSSIIKVEFQGSKNGVVVFPNPAADNVTVTLCKQKPGAILPISILSSNGVLCIKENAIVDESGNLSKNIQVDHLSPGVYFLKVTGLSAKFIK